MDNPVRNGTWLMLDAAGPVTVIGLVENGGWGPMKCADGEFIESLEPELREVLADGGVQLDQLQGCLYACGPGSTLGLRLAAMFLRGLMELPGLSGWECFQYQNLALSAASIEDGMLNRRLAAVAPWRRDRLHHTVMEPGQPARFHHDGISPQQAGELKLPGFLLGRRPGNAAQGIDWQPYPHERVPEVLSAFPELLEPVKSPTPFSAEEPEFARWSPQRHSAP
jgi:hypothetical protein